MSDIAYTAPGGPFDVGVRDGSYVDDRYASPHAADAGGRRLMFRVWYPASSGDGRRRRYFEGREMEVLGKAFAANLAAGGVPDAGLFDFLGAVETHSHVDAPISDNGPFPVVVFSGGAMGWVSQNLTIFEHLASNGYIVWSISHTGGSIGTIFPDGIEVLVDPAFQTALMESATNVMSASRLSTDVGERYEATKESVQPAGFGLYLQRWIDDHRALVDLIDAGGGPGDLDVARACDLDRLAYVGMSYGGAAATTGAQQDVRVKAAVSYDGGEWLPDLLDTEIRVPLLSISSDLAVIGGLLDSGPIPFFNEFFYEKLANMGTRSDIVRVMLPRTSHMELTDVVLAPEGLRSSLPGGGGCTAEDVVPPTNDLILSFLDHVLNKTDNGWPQSAIARHPDVRTLDVGHVAAWAARLES